MNNFQSFLNSHLEWKTKQLKDPLITRSFEKRAPGLVRQSAIRVFTFIFRKLNFYRITFCKREGCLSMEVRMTSKEYIDLGVEAVKMLIIVRIYPWLCIVFISTVLQRQAEKKADEQRRRRERKRKKTGPNEVCVFRWIKRLSDVASSHPILLE